MAQSLTGAFERFGYRSSAAKSLHCLLRGHGHRGLHIADAEGRIMIVTDVGDAAKRPRLRHSGAMPTGPRKARPDDRLRIEPGISRFRVWSFGPSRNDGHGSTRCLKIESEAIHLVRMRHMMRRPGEGRDP